MPKNALKKQRKRDAQRQAVRDRSQFVKVGAMRGQKLTMTHRDEVPIKYDGPSGHPLDSKPFASVVEMHQSHDAAIPDEFIHPPIVGVVERDAIAMTQEEFDGIKEQARTKKKSFAKVAGPAGWTLVDDGDAKVCRDWIRER